MTLLYLAGLAANHVAGSGASFASTPSADANFAASSVGNGNPGYPFKFSSAGTDDFWRVDFGAAKTFNYASVHGHNIDSGITSVNLQGSSASATGYSNLATFDVFSPTFFKTISSQSWRHVRLLFTGTNGNPIEIGEVVIGSAATGQTPLAGYQWRRVRPQSRQSGSLVSQVFASNLTTHKQRPVSLNFAATGAYASTGLTNRDEIDSWFDDSGFGVEPFVCVVDTNDPTSAIHGRLPSEYTWDRENVGSANYLDRTSFTIEEDPFSIRLAT